MDFQSLKSLQLVSSLFSRIENPLAHKIIYVTLPIILTDQQLLYTVEIGARYAAHGPSREDDLRNYVKRVAIEANDRTTLHGLEQEMDQLHAKNDREGLAVLNDRISDIGKQGKEGEELWRLLARISNYLFRPKREEHYLKRILAANPQNLWAANSLGRLFIRQHRVSEGVEVLRKMSLFHELNAERNFVIGNACLHADDLSGARKEFAKADGLAGGTDPRFKEGLAKVEFAEGNASAAMSILGDRSLSPEVLSFLNMRAIMAIRSGRFDDGFRHYELALKGCNRADEIMMARLKFNYGLGFVRANNPEQAAKLFEESVRLGGNKFKRAQKPLEITKAVTSKAAAGTRSEATSTSSFDKMEEMADLEYESLD
jgi:tetratricopeptide (TPR) repeat protein